MKLSCPFCPAEITTETTVCPSCGTKYDFSTLKFLKILIRESLKPSLQERREELRAPTKLKIGYSSPKELLKDYLFNLSLGGLFVETKDPLRIGERVQVIIFLPDKEKNLDVTGEVVWVRREEELTPEGRLPVGMGLRFLDLSKEARERIIGIINRASSDLEEYQTSER
jgi:uncharacterized protein (TIGR02266 family)